jgi:hypothetical protein
MTLTISLPAETEEKLRVRALAAGQEITRYVQALIEKELAAPLSLAEAAEPFARAIDATQVSDDEFTGTLVEAQDAARRQRHSNRQ